MSVTLAPPPPGMLPAEARAELARALAQLEDVSLAARFSATLGTPIEALKSRLPAGAQALLDGTVKRALASAMQTALKARPSANPTKLPDAWFHRGLAAAAGAAGGAFGLPGTLVELPVSTTLLLRQIAAIAEANGETLSDPMVAAECLKVFALGGRDARDDAAESGYFAVRLALAETLKGVASKGLVGGFLPGFLGSIAARFGGPVAMKLSAQAAPVLGAAAGAAVNLAFLEHFRGVAEGHFTVRRLERLHGAVAVKVAYQELLSQRDARFLD